jgi:hypothetical protein
MQLQEIERCLGQHGIEPGIVRIDENPDSLGGSGPAFDQHLGTSGVSERGEGERRRSPASGRRPGSPHPGPLPASARRS